MIVRGWQAQLDPTTDQARRLKKWSGALRFLWNRLLEAKRRNTKRPENSCGGRSCSRLPSR